MDEVEIEPEVAKDEEEEIPLKVLVTNQPEQKEKPYQGDVDEDEWTLPTQEKIDDYIKDEDIDAT